MISTCEHKQMGASMQRSQHSTEVSFTYKFYSKIVLFVKWNNAIE